MGEYYDHWKCRFCGAEGMDCVDWLSDLKSDLS